LAQGKTEAVTQDASVRAMHPGDLDSERDCRALLGLFVKLGESLRGHQPQDRRLIHSELLAQKVVFHACSILYLSRGTRLHDIPEAGVSFVDHASILVVARPLLESVWAFHQIFVEPKTEDELAFRYCCWMLAGFVQREKFPAMTGFGKEQLAKDKQATSHYREELQRTQVFERLDPRAQKMALNGKLWRPQPLRATAEAFLGKRFGAAIYAWLSSYQHGDALSAIQIRATDTYERQRQAAEPALLLVAISLSQMVEAYLSLWPHASLVVDRYPSIRMLVKAYLQFAEVADAMQSTEQNGQAQTVR